VGALTNLVEVVLVVEDVARSMRFYNELLGLELISPPHVPVKFLRIGPAGAGIPQQIVLVPRSVAAPTTPKAVLHHIGLEVAPADFEAERQRLIDAGFALRTGEHPFMPVEAFYLDDPDGNEVEIATWRGQRAPMS
jgi:catechol 2,3-dioxygenase-like lactoylglutathione lyase family enzyme